MVARNITLGFDGLVRLFGRAVAWAFKREIQRTHAALNTYARSRGA